MNRRGFFAGLTALLGLGVTQSTDLSAEVVEESKYVHEHKWLATPYVLVYGEAVVQRGPELQVCKCGALRIEYEHHRAAMLQRAYNNQGRDLGTTGSGLGYPASIQ